MDRKRVVITGRGAVSPFGLGAGALLDGVWSGRSGVRSMPEWREIRGLFSLLAAPVPPIEVKSLLPRGLRRSMGPMAIYAALAAREAVEDAGISPDRLASGRVGAVIGSTTGSAETYETFYRKFLEEQSVEDVRSGTFFQIMGHTCSANVCQYLGLRGEQWAPSSACTSSAQAIGLGSILVRSGRQDAVLCGGADEVHHTVTMVFDVVNAASRSNDAPERSPRPFDADRDGVVCGGGGGIVVLESLESAQERGATIHAELLGFGNVNDSVHIANPHPESMVRAMDEALKDAGTDPGEIDYVNAHATATEQGDVAEAKAIRCAIGPNVPVSSLKGHFGHTLGAAGVLETIGVLEMLRRQEVVPTLNLDRPDPDCDGVELVRALEGRDLNIVLKNNFALGGVNSALVLKRWRG